MKEINVEEIMEQIRINIKEKGYTQDLLSFDDIKKDVIENLNNQLNQPNMDRLKLIVGRANNAYLIQDTRKLDSDRAIIGKILVIFRKIIRRMTRFYIAPIVEDQNQYNALVIQSFNELMGCVEQQQAEIEILKKEIYKQKNN